jgi:hypothetical protein
MSLASQLILVCVVGQHANHADDTDVSAETVADDTTETLADWVNIPESRFTTTIVSDNDSGDDRVLVFTFEVSDGANPDEFGGAPSLNLFVAFQLLAAVVLAYLH